MDYLRQIEEDLRNLGVETKRYPEIKDATERALATLRTIRELYMSDMRKNTGMNPCLSQSNDISAPYILLCNYADATPKLVNLALNGIQMLLNYEVVPPSDVKNILRVLAIQASAPRTEFQLKILQVLLQMANSLSLTTSRSQYLTEATVSSFISQCLKMSRDSRSSVSVSSVALNTARQIATLVMDAAVASSSTTVSNRNDINSISGNGNNSSSSSSSGSSAHSSESSISAQRLITDLALFCRGLPGEWIKGVAAPQTFALDLLHDLLAAWSHMFRSHHEFEMLLYTSICPAIKGLLRNLQEDYTASAAKSSMATAAGLTTRVIRIARILLMEYATLSPQMLGEVDLLVTLMLHSMQPYMGDTDNGGAGDGAGSAAGTASSQFRSQILGLGMSIGMGLGLGSTNSSASTGAKRSNEETPGLNNGISPSLGGGFLTLGRPGVTIDCNNASSGRGKIPSHPVGCCLEALLSFFLVCDEQCGGGSIVHGGVTSTSPDTQLGSAFFAFVSSAMINVMMSASAVISGGLAVDSTLLDFNKSVALKGCAADRLVLLLEGYFTGGENPTDLKVVLRTLHEYPLVIPAPFCPNEVLVLAFLLNQVVTRLMLKHSIPSQMPQNASNSEAATVNRRSQTSGVSSKASSPNSERVLLFVSTASLVGVNPPSIYCSSNQSGMLRVCDSVYEPLEECCSAVLTALSSLSSQTTEDPIPSNPTQNDLNKVSSQHSHYNHCSYLLAKRAIGMLTELALAAGFLGQTRACSLAVSTVCRNTVPLWDYQLQHQHQQQQQKYQRQQQIEDSSSAQLQAPWLRFHWTASIRLLQLVHFLADYISDWDLVVHALEQISCIIVSISSTAAPSLPSSVSHEHPSSINALNASQKQSSSSRFERTLSGLVLEDNSNREADLPSPTEIEEILNAINRFKDYTCFISDEALVRLMTSLVTLSLNSFGTTVTHSPFSYSSSASASNVPSLSGSDGSNMIRRQKYPPPHMYAHSLPYLQDGINLGAIINYSLLTVIEITKLNGFRASCIWQMVTSHLRIIASMRNSGTRYVAVAATLDVVKSALSECVSSSPHGVGRRDMLYICEETIVSTPESPGHRPETSLTDQRIFQGILRPLRTVLCPHPIHVHQTECTSFSVKSAVNSSGNNKNESMLSPHDILHVLSSLAVVRYDDVRTDIIVGLLELMQGIGGEVSFGTPTDGDDSSGWTAILDLLHCIPSSMTSSPHLSSINSETAFTPLISEAKGTQESSSSDGPSTPVEWPKASLVTAFNVLKLLADEFLESMNLRIIGEIIKCLSAFAAQTADINISLTSIEMLWKVSDVAMSPPPPIPLTPPPAPISAPVPPHTITSRSLTSSSVPAALPQSLPGLGHNSGEHNGAAIGGFEIFQMMAACLEDLSMDPRPEVRKSAVNTLFSSLTAHAAANLLSASQLRIVCKKSVFPLFQLQFKSESTRRASSEGSKEEALSAPELKKGIKMNVHHSRDTAKKQWSETRTLSLRGLSRLIRTITRSLLIEADSWFKREIWMEALELSHASIERGSSNTLDNSNTEISLAAIDLLFAMLKTVSTPSTPVAASLNIHQTGSRTESSTEEKRRITELAATDSFVAERESARDDLWQTTWHALRDATGVRCLSADLALHMCHSLSGLYASSSDAEFRYSANIKILLEMVVVLSRPRLLSEGPTHPPVINNRSSVVDIQLQRAVIDLLKSIKTVDSLAFLSLVSCLSELCFSFQNVLLSTQRSSCRILGAESQSISLGPCAEKLRIAAGKYLFDILQASAEDREGGKKSMISSTEDGINEIVPVISKGFALPTLDVIVKRFHYDICESALTARADSVGVHGPSTAPHSNSLTVGNSVVSDGSSSGSGVWFLSSIGRLLSASADLVPSSPSIPSSSAPTQISPRRASVADSMHKFQHRGSSTHTSAALNPLHCRPYLAQEDSPSSLSRFRPLHDLTFEMDLLISALSICLEISELDSTASHHRMPMSTKEMTVSLSLWSSVLSVTACCLSPWRDCELASSPSLILPRSGQGAGFELSPLTSTPIKVQNSTSSSSSITSHNLCTAADISANVPVSSLLDVLFPDTEREAQPWKLSLLNVCEASGVLLVHAMLVTSIQPIIPTSSILSFSTTPSPSNTLIYSGSAYRSFSASLAALWEKMIVAVKCERTDSTLRKKAISVSLEILRSLLSGIYREERGKAIFDSNRHLCALTARFIDDFSSLDTPISVALTGASAEPDSHRAGSYLPHSGPRERDVAEEDNEAVSVWLLSCQQDVISTSLSQSVQAANMADTASRSPLILKKKINLMSAVSVDHNLIKTRAKSHLLLILPTITALICSLDGADDEVKSNDNCWIRLIRAAACRAIARTNMSALVESLIGLEESNMSMTIEISRLQVELNNASSSAASLPF